ncbi:hypothetical protein C8Q79DRAFT_354438 [Trametes meyenii]|nr:hypothetical protein C8Q79DRAFT_354438 [Trametes meyenii]
MLASTATVLFLVATTLSSTLPSATVLEEVGRRGVVGCFEECTKGVDFDACELFKDPDRCTCANAIFLKDFEQCLIDNCPGGAAVLAAENTLTAICQADVRVLVPAGAPSRARAWLMVFVGICRELPLPRSPTFRRRQM